MQVHFDIVFANAAQGAVGQANFALVQINAGGADGFGDVAGADGTEQLAFVAGVGSDGNGQVGQLGGTGISLGLLLGSLLLELGATSFESLDVGSGGCGGLALRQQEVTGVTALDVHFVAQVAQVGDLFQQDDIH